AAAVVRRLVHRMGTFAPAAVITFGPEGLYWHPDHIAAHRLTARALHVLRRRKGWAPPLYFATWPDTLAGELVAAAGRRGLATQLWDIPPECFGVTADSITDVIDIRGHVDQKLRAL